jgi:hypothetical protein
VTSLIVCRLPPLPPSAASTSQASTPLLG